MLIDANNSNFVPGFMSQQPQASLRRAGLGGVGQGEAVTDAVQGTTWQEIQAGINSQILWFINLDRLQSGQQAIAPEYAAPQVQAKLDPQTKNMLTLGTVALGGILLLAVAKR